MAGHLRGIVQRAANVSGDPQQERLANIILVEFNVLHKRHRQGPREIRVGPGSKPVKVTEPMPHVIPVGVRSVKVKSCGFKGMVKEDT